MEVHRGTGLARWGRARAGRGDCPLCSAQNRTRLKQRLRERSSAWCRAENSLSSSTCQEQAHVDSRLMIVLARHNISGSWPCSVRRVALREHRWGPGFGEALGG